MICEVGKGEHIIGRTYPKGNVNGEKGEPITLKVDQITHYYRVEGAVRTYMEYDPKTGESKKINIPLL